MYDKTNYEKIIEGITIGDGPDQILTPTSLVVEDKEFYIKDGSSKILKINIDSILIKEQISPVEYISLPKTGEIFLSFITHNDRFISNTYSKEKHFVEFNKNGKVLNYFGEYPKLEVITEIPDNAYEFYWEGRYAMMNNNFIKVYIDIDKISIYDSIGNEINTTYSGKNSNHEARFQNGRLVNPDRRVCYKSVYTTKNRIFALYSGKYLSEISDVTLGYEIHVFDESGIPIEQYHLASPVSDFCVDEDKKIIYGINYLEDSPIIVYSLE